MHKKSLAVILAILVGVASIYLLTRESGKVASSSTEGCGFVYLNPDRCDGEPVGQQEYLVLQKELEKEISEYKEQGKAEHVAVYFRDLRNGPILAIDQNTTFAPMSLLKLPIMISLLKHSESNPGTLEHVIRTPDLLGGNVQVMPEAQKLQAGTEYTVENLMHRMIVYSDNRSLSLLGQYLDSLGANHAVILQTMADLGMTSSEDTDPNKQLTIREYASLFRVLYNASYLNQRNSEWAMDTLSKTTFMDGLRRGLPAEMKLAHKFGVRDAQDGQVLLHDCGIVYAQKITYLVCVMTQGEEYSQLSSIIGNISRSIFDEVNFRQE
jgi:beta-lactamase class A